MLAVSGLGGIGVMVALGFYMPFDIVLTYTIWLYPPHRLRQNGRQTIQRRDRDPHRRRLDCRRSAGRSGHRHQQVIEAARAANATAMILQEADTLTSFFC